MEYIGYILFFPNLKQYYVHYGTTIDPFKASFYIEHDDAIATKEMAEEYHRENVELVKVKKTISKIS